MPAPTPAIPTTHPLLVAICACCAGLLPFANLDLLDPLPLAFLYREALYENDQSSGRALEEECGEEFGGIHDSELLDEAVEVGDQIYTTSIHLPPSISEIHAGQTTSQWLSQAFAANATLQEFWNIIPSYLHVFKNVFSKAWFDLLLECKHCKVYLLVPREQDKLDAFLQENLDFSCIHPSKSLMAFLVFFIKKKDGLLQLVQDYQVLNAMMVKNHYPLFLIFELINNLWGA
ncbi:hypothetical protein E4T56_gene18951 [Termitomyces sp. T112]|nr:hypothetical protein E4T56_gene18951 [Termitomyces sp. T112]